VEAWARDYAGQLKQQADQNKKLLDGDGPACWRTRRKTQSQHQGTQNRTDLRTSRGQLRKLQNQVKSFEKHIQQEQKK